MEVVQTLFEEEPEFTLLLLELADRLPRLDVARVVRLLQEELDEFLVQRRAA